MTYYFGFEPSEQLNTMIEEANEVINGDVKTDYYPYRNALAQQIARELIDNLLVQLVNVIPNAERKATMQKIIGTVESATNSLLKILMGKDDNDAVLASYYFLKDKTVFVDNDNQRRIGFKLDDKVAGVILNGFDAVSGEAINEQDEQQNRAQFKAGLEAMNDVVLDHFINEFTQTLPLGLLKRKSIPLARSAINTGLSVATNKLLPQLPADALGRLVSFYRPFIVKID